MNESLELRNRINEMRSINNLEISDKKLLNNEKNKLVNPQKIEKKIYSFDLYKPNFYFKYV